MSKSAPVRGACGARPAASAVRQRPLLALLETSKLAADVEAVDHIDEYLYGSLELET
jgi:hypothetical protein